MKIHTLPVGEFEVNCYVVTGADNAALVIDPGADAAAIVAYLARHRLVITAYLVTHGHIDHISALAEVCAAYPAPVAIHECERTWAFSTSNQMPPFYPPPQPPTTAVRSLDDGQEWHDAGLRYVVITSPGHTPGGVCFYFPQADALFTGDTLFAGSVGRTDLAGGNDRILAQSLGKLSKLPARTAVYPGHGPATTLAEELAHNPFMPQS